MITNRLFRIKAPKNINFFKLSTAISKPVYQYCLQSYMLTLQATKTSKFICRTFSNAESIGDPYKALGISKNATKDEIKKAFRTMAKTYHPDKDIQNEEIFRRIL